MDVAEVEGGLARSEWMNEAALVTGTLSRPRQDRFVVVVVVVVVVVWGSIACVLA